MQVSTVRHTPNSLGHPVVVVSICKYVEYVCINVFLKLGCKGTLASSLMLATVKVPLIGK
mgnify:CR=1 FL=1